VKRSDLLPSLPNPMAELGHSLRWSVIRVEGSIQETVGAVRDPVYDEIRTVFDTGTPGVW
jgi:hypothetical protein